MTTRRGRVAWVARLAAVVGALIWIRALVSGPAPLVGEAAVLGPRYRASGVVHIHTNLSDGRGAPAEVIAAGRRAGADFIVITDHNRVDPEIFDRLPRTPGDPLVILGSEVSTDAGHVLAIGIRPPGFRFSGTLSEVLDDIRHLGGCAFTAHPTSPRGETRFTRENEPGSWGVEVVNGDTAWREASPLALSLAAWTYPVRPAFALARTLGTFGEELALWDRVLARRFAPAIGGTDAHGRIPLTRTTSVPVPSYDALFGLVRTVVQLDEPLSDRPTIARTAISKALCAGSSVVAIPSEADPKGFSFVVRGSAGDEHGPGSTVRHSPGMTLRVGGPMPRETRLRLIEAGKQVATGAGVLDFPVAGPGVFRVEAYVPGETTPWILSNPISVLTAEGEWAREQAARPIAPSYVEGRTEIDRFEGATAFAPEHDPGSRIDAPILDPLGGRGHGAAALLSFHLNPTPKPPVWCALVDRTRRDLSASTGVSFWMKADGEYRVWFQIRDLNPASADEGTEAWFASVRTSTAWTLHNIPFASLRSINRTSDGSFDPKQIAHIVFVIDHGAMPFGSQGKVWIDDLM
ncbi:MAG TPA: CehA/McbA family metallohydrolase, partial [Vicinamibacteria bacterium]|nr:CehA/McbA family metallohydrolase [Vicinamibacteria bacterium]